MPYSIQEVRGAVARGWCAPANTSKEMDSDLAEAITQEIWKMLHTVPQADDRPSAPDYDWRKDPTKNFGNGY